MSSRSHTENVLGYMRESCACTFHSHRCVYVSLKRSNKHTSNTIGHMFSPHRQPTQEELFASEVQPISNKKSNGVHTAHPYIRIEPLKWIFSYWASNAECRPRRRKRSRLAAQRRPHRKSIECCHGGSRDKQKKQRTGTSSSSSVITESRGRACSPSVSLLRSLPPREASRGVSGHPGRIHFSSGDGYD
ncbi:hypothetical protein TCDM_12015 [Trypanosoma cruzi Dm28c]|uniref:Uncharacterized protein n=1 Tax=Trypanosoma cruzi Dm28c TaxID=1416333 RepID=V5CYZ3_TRYCR|nr:hypothetical protein TCDM_12015 [Trypanosoma cruzi Dm28c]